MMHHGRGGPQGAPRGLLVHWVLRRIAMKPTYGFEILREIETKTEGAWRPGPGSVYPILKRLVSGGLVATEKGKGARADQVLYKITKKGLSRLEGDQEMFRTIGKRWSAMRGIYTDLIAPDATSGFLLEGARNMFESARLVFEKNRGQIPESDADLLVREYSSMLQSQLEWVNRQARRQERRSSK